MVMVPKSRQQFWWSMAPDRFMHACCSHVLQHAGCIKWLVEKEREDWKHPLCVPRFWSPHLWGGGEKNAYLLGTVKQGASKSLKIWGCQVNPLESFLWLDSVASKRLYLPCRPLVPADGGLARVSSPQSGEDLCPQPVEDPPKVQTGCSIWVRSILLLCAWHWGGLWGAPSFLAYLLLRKEGWFRCM